MTIYIHQVYCHTSQLVTKACFKIDMLLSFVTCEIVVFPSCIFQFQAFGQDKSLSYNYCKTRVSQFQKILTLVKLILKNVKYFIFESFGIIVRYCLEACFVCI